MELRVEQVQGISVVTIPVESLDAGNTEDFKKHMIPLLDQANSMALDLAKLRFVDSSGLGAILSCLRKLNAKGGDLKVFNVTNQVRLLFELVRMHRIVDILPDREAVFSAFSLSTS